MKKTAKWIASQIKDLLMSFPAENSRMKKRWLVALVAMIGLLIVGCGNNSNDSDESKLYMADAEIDEYGVLTKYSGKEMELSIPDGVVIIGEGAFSGRKHLECVIIPDSVVVISKNAFSGCTSLTDVIIPNSVMLIEDYAFNYCTNLKNITISDGVKAIGDGAFFECTSLTSVTIGDGVKAIGREAFSGCTSLTNVTIPKSVRSIGGSAFYFGDKFVTVQYGGTKEEWEKIEGLGWLLDERVTIVYKE